MHRALLLIPSFAELARDLARISYTHRAATLVISVAVAATFAGILLSSNEGRRLAGSWVKYVGWAFLAYSFQYFFRLLGWYLQDDGQIFKVACDFLANIGSGANNLFFLIAALILLNRQRTRFTPAALLRRNIFVLIVLTPAAFTTAANFLFVESQSPRAAAFGRLPDALISAACLGLFGYATMRNFLTHRRLYWATGIITIGVVYGTIQLVYAGNPVIAKWYDAEIRAVLNSADYAPKPSEPVQYLDSSLFALALPLKMLLFVPAFYLFFTLVVAAHDFRKVLRVVTEKKRSYLSSNGIVEAIGQSVSASRVEVFIKLPGTETPSAWRISWPVAQQDDSFLVLGEETNPRLLKVLCGGEEIPLRDSGDRPQAAPAAAQPEPSAPQVMLPVKFNGAVIGCLKATFRQEREFNYAALQQLRSMADLLAPAVQDYRALASLDQLSDRFARLQVQRAGTEFDELTRQMADILHDVLSPLASGFLLEAGFRSNRVLKGEGEPLRLLEQQAVRYDPEDLTTQTISTEEDEVRVYKNRLELMPREDSTNHFPIGNIVLILPSRHDELNRPTLGDYDLYRRAVVSHTADAYLDIVRDHLRYELNALSIRLNTESLTPETWLSSIQEMAGRVGLLWVGVTQADSNKILGDPLFADRILPKLGPETRSRLEEAPLSCVGYCDDVTNTNHVMRIRLDKSRHQVWFGIARDGFGPELDFPSPWKVFLKDFSEIVDSALATLFEVEKSKEKVAKMAGELAVMNIALTTGHLMHQLANKVDEQLFPAESLWGAARSGDLDADDVQQTQIEAILSSARVMKELLAIFKNVTSTNTQRPCSLREIINRSFKFHQQIAGQQSGITFRNKLEEDVSIDVPYNVALFALTNLVGNSKDAIVERKKDAGKGYVGEIVIDAKVTKDEVICVVLDNGQGIPQHIKKRLFTLGVTRDKSKHNGWGLYFTKSSLNENGSHIDAPESEPGRTKFTLRFPRDKSHH
ncbi:MAG TPA: ATP-binding protein [Pyrinomonadaceae bacterium]|jgi:hypothetical protein